MIKPQAIYTPLYTDKEKFIILITGGRGSGKSFNASAFIERLTFEKSLDRSFAHTILYSRYTMVSAHMSIIPEMMEKIDMDGTGKYFQPPERWAYHVPRYQNFFGQPNGQTEIHPRHYDFCLR